MDKSIEIITWRGCVIEVTGVPEGFTYRVVDLDETR